MATPYCAKEGCAKMAAFQYAGEPLCLHHAEEFTARGRLVTRLPSDLVPPEPFYRVRSFGDGFGDADQRFENWLNEEYSCGRRLLLASIGVSESRSVALAITVPQEASS